MTKRTVIDDIDVLVIGGGIAGTFAGIKAKQAGAEKVVQVDKGHVGKSGNSAFGAGVLHVRLPSETDADADDRFKRLARAQGYLVQADLIRDHVEQSWDIVEDMKRWGAEFEMKETGEIESHAARGAHPVVMFHGPQMMDALMKTSRKQGIQHLNRTMIADLLVSDSGVAGAVGFNTQTGEILVLKAKAVVLATGSTWYKSLCPGQRDCTGDGYGMAFRAGALLHGGENNDMITHAFPARFDIGPGLNMFVGLGGFWVNKDGQKFMGRYNPSLKDRAGLRNLMYAFVSEAKQGRAPIYMDMTHFTPADIERMRKVIPLPTRMFERAGLIVNQKFVDKVEWMLVGPVGRPGIKVDRSFASSLPGLYACGEAAASSAVVSGLSAAATSGAQAGKNAAGFAKHAALLRISSDFVDAKVDMMVAPLKRKNGTSPDQIVVSVQENTIPYNILLLRKAERMAAALKNLEYVRDNLLGEVEAYDSHYLRMAHEAENLLLTAQIQLKTSLMRTESRVGWREDYPYTDNKKWFKWITVRNVHGEIVLSTVEAEKKAFRGYGVDTSKELHHAWDRLRQLQVVSIQDGGIKWV